MKAEGIYFTNIKKQSACKTGLEKYSKKSILTILESKMVLLRSLENCNFLWCQNFRHLGQKCSKIYELEMGLE
jgi:hypothetical protein